MWPTIFTARQSLRRALAAWPLSTPNAGWTICPTGPVKVQSKPFSNLEQPVWDGLCTTPGPFVDWRLLASAEEAGCTGPASGWHPLALLENDAYGQPPAGAPARLKDHSRCECVFEFVWARAACQLVMYWYPKRLVACRLTTVNGPRLLGAEQHP